MTRAAQGESPLDTPHPTHAQSSVQATSLTDAHSSLEVPHPAEAVDSVEVTHPTHAQSSGEAMHPSAASAQEIRHPEVPQVFGTDPLGPPASPTPFVAPLGAEGTVAESDSTTSAPPPSLVGPITTTQPEIPPEATIVRREVNADGSAVLVVRADASSWSGGALAGGGTQMTLEDIFLAYALGTSKL
jgi:hypothetical protein